MDWSNFAWFAIPAVGLWLVAGVMVYRKNDRLAGTLMGVGIALFAAFIVGFWITLGRPPMRTMGETRLWYSLFLSGVAAGPFWPSIQSDGAIRVKGDYTMQMILYSCAGVPGCGFFTAAMGILGDKIGLRASFYLIPLCFFIVFLLMGYDWLTERREKRAGPTHGQK